MNSRLNRQIDRFLGGQVIPDGWKDFIQAVDKDYQQFDKDRRRRLVNQFADSLFVIDPQTSKFIDVNEGACLNLRYSRQELLTKGVVDIEAILPDHFSWKEHVEKTKRIKSVMMVGVHKRKDNTTYPVEINVKYIKADEEDYIVAVARDISRRKKLEDIVQKSEKMSSVGQLAGGVAHEINNPLGIILGFTQSLKAEFSMEGPQKTALDFIEKEALRCKSLVQNLLIYSRKTPSEQYDEMDMNNVTKEALSLVLAQGRVKKVEIVNHFTEGLPKIYANNNQIQQILINLCNNAMDAMPEGGVITVETGQGEKGGAECVTLKVKDTGTGIPRAIQSKIYDPFFTTKDVGKGTGLGLSLVSEIVKDHKGTVEIESEIGKGTTFTVFFPTRSQEDRKVA